MSSRYFKNISQEAQFQKELTNFIQKETTEKASSSLPSICTTGENAESVATILNKNDEHESQMKKSFDRKTKDKQNLQYNVVRENNGCDPKTNVIVVGKSVTNVETSRTLSVFNKKKKLLKNKVYKLKSPTVLQKSGHHQLKHVAITATNTTKCLKLEEEKSLTKKYHQTTKKDKRKCIVNNTIELQQKSIQPKSSDVHSVEKEELSVNIKESDADQLRSFENMEPDFYSLIDKKNKEMETRRKPLFTENNNGSQLAEKTDLSSNDISTISTFSARSCDVRDPKEDIKQDINTHPKFTSIDKNKKIFKDLFPSFKIRDTGEDPDEDDNAMSQKSRSSTNNVFACHSESLDSFFEAIADEKVANKNVCGIQSNALTINGRRCIYPVNSYYYQSRNVLYERPIQIQKEDGNAELNRHPTLTGFPSKMHHVCTMQPDQKLLGKQQFQSLLTHAPNKFKQGTNQKPMLSNNDKTPAAGVESDQCIRHYDTDFDQQARLAHIADKIIKELETSEVINDKKFMKLEQIVSKMFDDKDKTIGASIVGTKIDLKSDNSRLYNIAVPPKLYIHPAEMTSVLAPKYIGLRDTYEPRSANYKDITFHHVNENDVKKTYSKEHENTRNRILNSKRRSLVDLQKIAFNEEFTDEIEVDKRLLSEDEASDDATDESEDTTTDTMDRFETVIQMRRRLRNNSTRYSGEDIILQRRCRSQPDLLVRKQPEHELLQSDYNHIMEETYELAGKLENVRNEIYRQEEIKVLQKNAEKIIEPKAKDNQERKLKISNWIDVVTTQNIHPLVRSLSSGNLFDSLDRNPENSNSLHFSKCASDTNLRSALANLDNTINSKKNDLLSVLKEDYWYKWMDEVYALNETSQNIENEIPNRANIQSLSSSNLSLADIHQVLSVEDKKTYQMVQDEIASISQTIKDTSNKTGFLAFHLCRRGACYKKIGELKNSLKDLNRAIELEPKLLDAYWHRHLLYLIQKNLTAALDDLQTIVTQNPSHTNALRSRAEIFSRSDELGTAIVNYSQAIRSSPKDPELYFARAVLFEQRGDELLALEDYKVCNALQPENIRAIEKIGMYHFQNRSWIASVKDFTELLSKQSKNVNAYFCRALANIKLCHYKKAITDLSVCIHLQPDNYKLFYHRGCLLRKASPKQALQDFSVSLLLESSILNIKSLLHRGILHVDIGKFEQASIDFQAAIRLDPKFAPAYVNLGVIDMMHRKNVLGAIKRFNVALVNDPTYVRAVLCRAEAYEQRNQIEYAIKDYTRAIHMRPNNTDFVIARGRLMLKKEKYELASLHIRQCAAMSDTRTSSVTQLAAITTFLKNFEEAIEILDTSLKSKPLPHLLLLSGKTKMKADLFVEALESLNEALNIMKPWNPKTGWPQEAAEIFYLVAMCHVELRNYKQALEALNNALKIYPEYAEACYQRGLVKIKLGSPKGIYDFNRALTSKPTFYQAFLARACYYDMQGRHAKAIMNCNEAIKLQSKSVRAYLNRGVIKYKIKAYRLAINDLTDAIAIDPSCYLAYFNRAVCYHARKFYFKALKDYSIVLLNDDSLKMKALCNRGLSYFQIGDMNNARQDFEEILQDDPTNANIHHALGLCYYHLNNREQAIRLFTTSLEHNTRFYEALIARGNVLLDYNNAWCNQLARRDYIRAFHMNPLCIPARVNLALSIKDQGHYMRAWKFLTRTIEIEPNDKAALEARSLVNLQMGNTFGAFLDVTNAIKIGKTGALLTIRGVINQCLGHVVNAMSDFQEATRLDPSYSIAYYNAANLYLLHRQYRQAISYYNQTLSWKPNDPDAYVNRGVAKYIINDENALDDLNTAVASSPHWSHAHFNRGVVYFAMKMYEKADQDFTRALQLQPRDALIYKRRADARGKLSRKEEALKDYRISVILRVKEQ